ncbi:hypothetical protein BDN72DRAFT_743408, partial [Pluteus cervinus]
LASIVKVGGLEAWALWDTGSTTTGITPAFAQVADIQVDQLVDPHVLQLGTVGSRSFINYGADVEMDLPGFHGKAYVDVANFDRYDMIIGTPFMRKLGVHLDFERNEIVVNGIAHPALQLKE